MKRTLLAAAILFLAPLCVFCAAPSLYDAWDEFAETARRTFGTQSMKNRAELVGAELFINSSEEGGTEVKLEIPIRRTHGATGGGVDDGDEK